MPLQRVNSINLFQASSGNQTIDTILSNQLLHLELHLDDSSLIMSSIPTYIAKTLYEHQKGKKFSHKYLNLLDIKKIPGNPFKRVKSVNIRVAYNCKRCHLAPKKIAWCNCDGFSGIDSSTYFTYDDKEHTTDLFMGILIALMYDAPVRFNGKLIEKIRISQIGNQFTILIDDIGVIGASEPLLSFLTHFDYTKRLFRSPDLRLSLEAFVLFANRLCANSVQLDTINITDIQKSGTYVACVSLTHDGNKQIINMIPSHAILLALLLDFSKIYVDDKLTKKKER